MPRSGDEVRRVKERLAELTGVSIDELCSEPEPSKKHLPNRAETTPGHSDAFSRIVSWVNVRDRSVSEVSSRLSDEGYDEAIVESAVLKALRLNILSDDRFSESFVRGKLRLGWGRFKILRALESHGITPSSLSSAVNDLLSSEVEEERAVSLLLKQLVVRSYTYEKAVRFLAGRGFDLSVCHAAARKAFSSLVLV